MIIPMITAHIFYKDDKFYTINWILIGKFLSVNELNRIKIN